MIEKQLNQLTQDKQDLVNNLNMQGVNADNNETFTELVPKVLDVKGGGTSTYYIFPNLESGDFNTEENKKTVRNFIEDYMAGKSPTISIKQEAEDFKIFYNGRLDVLNYSPDNIDAIFLFDSGIGEDSGFNLEVFFLGTYSSYNGNEQLDIDMYEKISLTKETVESFKSFVKTTGNKAWTPTLDNDATNKRYVDNNDIKEFKAATPFSDGLIVVNATTNGGKNIEAVDIYNGVDAKYPNAAAGAKIIKELNDKIVSLETKIQQLETLKISNNEW